MTSFSSLINNDLDSITNKLEMSSLEDKSTQTLSTPTNSEPTISTPIVSTPTNSTQIITNPSKMLIDIITIQKIKEEK